MELISSVILSITLANNKGSKRILGEVPPSSGTPCLCHSYHTPHRCRRLLSSYISCTILTYFTATIYVPCDVCSGFITPRGKKQQSSCMSFLCTSSFLCVKFLIIQQVLVVPFNHHIAVCAVLYLGITVWIKDYVILHTRLSP